MGIIFSHPTGNANVRAALTGLADAHLLTYFFTTIVSFPGSFTDKISRFPSLSEIQRRNYSMSLQPFTKCFPLYEAGRLLSLKAKLNNFTKHETGIFSIDQVFQRLDKKMAEYIQNAQESVKAVYCYEDGAEFSFTKAKKKNITCLYDLPIGYWRTAHKLLETEKEKWPAWSNTLTGLKNSEQKLKRKDEELRLADVIYVASSFTAKSLHDYPDKLAPVQIIPYGFPPVKEVKDYTGLINRKKIKLLFVGGLSQRKGIADLFFAVNALQNYVELTVVGKKPTAECAALNDALNKHTWIPALPHDEVLQLMRQQDILVFPSLFEGFGLVITEAMSQGMPVITTERTAGPDLIEHAENGWLIEAGSATALQQAIEYFIQHPDKIQRQGKAAQETARKRPWSVYGNELSASIEKILHD